MIRILFHITMIVGLTLTTQLGGVAWIAAMIMARGIVARLFAFALAYGAISIGALYAAPAFGREALPCLDGGDALAMRSPVFCLLNRHYVSHETAAVTRELVAHVAGRHSGTLTQVLDANFPFFEGFPLLPHLSHDDGRKVDLAFYYRDQEGDYLRGRTRSPIGYWAFESEGADCPDVALTLRWDMAWLQPYWHDWMLEETRLKTALDWLANDARVEKVFVEPPLAERLGTDDPKIRFQGCRAARHDDHIHFQVAGVVQ